MYAWSLFFVLYDERYPNCSDLLRRAIHRSKTHHVLPSRQRELLASRHSSWKRFRRSSFFEGGLFRIRRTQRRLPLVIPHHRHQVQYSALLLVGGVLKREIPRRERIFHAYRLAFPFRRLDLNFHK